MKRSILFILLTFSYIFSLSQDTCNFITDVVATYPIFPNEKGGVTIYFDATKGNKALMNYNGDVYIHTGVITVNSPHDNYWLYVVSDWGENLPKTKMTRIGTNLYMLKIDDIHAYYGVPDNEKILALAMVFRSDYPVGGDYLVGRNTDGSDIHIILYDSVLNVKIVSPAQNQFILPTEYFDICAYGLLNQTLEIYIDNQLISKVDTSFINTTIFAGDLSSGEHTIKAIAIGSNDTAVDLRQFFILPSTEIAPMPEQWQPGVNVLNDSTVAFVLWEPANKKQFAFVIGDFNEWNLSLDYMMKKTPDGQYFWLIVSGLNPNEQYAYQYLIDGELYLADPYSHLILDPWNDQYIPSEVFPNLKPYPDKASGIVSVFQIEKPEYQWEIDSFVPPDYRSLVIYELLIRDFVPSHSIKEVQQKLDYLQQLGINAIELMPFNEFEGNISWGYNPDFYFAVDKYYGTAEDFKRFIDECHKRGIAVIMDIVLNHSYGLNPMVRMYWDSQYNRPSADNPWFNPVPRHPLSPGYDFNHESPETKKFVKDVLKYWLTEFKIDGFRFDLSKGFTQRYSADIGSWSAYDQSRIDILSEYYNYIKSINPNAIVILEHFAEDREEQVLAEKGFLLWSNSNYSAAQAAMGWLDGSDFSRIIYTTHGFSEPRNIAYFESHDEERIMYKVITWGNSSAIYSTRVKQNALQRIAILVPFLMLTPGPKMIWQFQELGYDYSINTCENGSINEYCRTAPKPIRWDYYEDSLRRQLYLTFAKFIKWHTTDTSLFNAKYSFDFTGAVKKLKIQTPDKNIYLIANFDVQNQSTMLFFPHTGYWFDLVNDTLIYISETQQVIQLAPSEIHIYTDKFVPFNVCDSCLNQIQNLPIFPNPATNYVVIKTQPNSKIYIYNATGKLIKAVNSNSDYTTIFTTNWQSGYYFVKVLTETDIKYGIIIKN